MESAVSEGKIEPKRAIVAGRYRLEGQIAEGGMGRVFAATDLSTQRSVALKRVLEKYTSVPRVCRFFELEYHTLAQIEHPHIIKVYDYGVDADGPYYTMELLDGQDLNKLAPIEYREACSYLRDLASCLALLHTRRLLHRDLSPKNVRRTEHGHCKLLDFGTMATFGVAGDVVGTPPMVAPETLRGMPLDHRADLYSLGALAYWILTRRHAFGARRLEDLHLLWGKLPPRPSTLVAGIPRAMDDLVMSLLSIDPMARPSSAADVIEHLNAVGGLQREKHVQETAQSYLLSSALVGRQKEMRRLTRGLKAAIGGKGGACLLESNPGVGKTRLLEELSLQAQLAGALVVRVESRSNRGHYGVARALALSLLTTAPEEAKEALQPYRPTIGHLLPELAVGTDRLAVLPVEMAERRMVLQSALVSWFSLISQARALVLLVDDVHRADEDSVAFLSSLAIESKARRIYIVATRALWAAGSSAPPAKALSSMGQRMRLHRMGSKQTAELVRGLFGDVPNAERLAQWMHSITTGNAMQNMELARHLVEQRIVRYGQGMWVLPEEVSSQEVPHSLAEAMASRAAALSPAARALVEAVSIRRGSMSLELCMALADGQGDSEIFQALEELIWTGVLEMAGDEYRFCQEPFRQTILSTLGSDRRQQLHLRLGQVLLASGMPRLQDEIEVGWHLLHGGDENRGAELLAAAAEKVAKEEDDLWTAVPAVAAALRVYQRQGRAPAEILRLQSRMVSWGPYSERYDLTTKYGEETVRELYHYSGLELASRLGRYMGGKTALPVAQRITAGQTMLAPKHKRGPSPAVALGYLVKCLPALVATKAFFVDSEGIFRLAGYARPLSAFGKKHTGYAIYLYARAFELQHSGRFGAMSETLDALIALLDDPTACTDMPDEDRQDMKQGAQLDAGLWEAMEGKPRALERAAQLESRGTNLGQLGAHQVRMTYHLHRGEKKLAAEHRRKVETHGMRKGSTWQVDFLIAPVAGLASALMLDMTGLKASLEALSRLVKQAPTLKPIRDALRIPYMSLRGKHEQAIALGERLVSKHPPWKSEHWVDMRGALANALSSGEQPGRAKQVCEETLAALGDERRSSVGGHIVALQLGIAEMGLRNLERAAEIVDELIAEKAVDGSPLVMGRCHQVRTLIALLGRDRTSFEHHLSQMRIWFAATENSVLLAQVNQIEDAGKQNRAFSSIPPPPAEHDIETAVQQPGESAHVDSVFEQCSGPEERAQRALQVVLERAGADSGCLYLVQRDGLRLAASTNAAGLAEQFQRHLQNHVDAILEVAPSVSSETGSVWTQRLKGRTFRLDGEALYTTFVLTVQDRTRLSVVGGVVVGLSRGGNKPPVLRSRFLSTLGRKLLEVGDAILNSEFQDAVPLAGEDD